MNATATARANVLIAAVVGFLFGAVTSGAAFLARYEQRLTVLETVTLQHHPDAAAQLKR